MTRHHDNDQEVLDERSFELTLPPSQAPDSPHHLPTWESRRGGSYAFLAGHRLRRLVVSLVGQDRGPSGQALTLPGPSLGAMTNSLSDFT